MHGPLAHRCWSLAYFASWVLAVGAGGWLLAAVGFGAYGNGAVIDDDAALLGLPLGAVAGFFLARSTLRRRSVHRGLMIVGPLLAIAGAVSAVTMFAAARASRGDGPFTGLGEVVVALVSLFVAGMGMLGLVAGAAGLLAARSAAGDARR